MSSYQPPTQTSSTQPSGFMAAGTASFEDPSRPVQYICGDCDSKVILRQKDLVLCKECGHRVLYKERTNRMVQFEAR